MAFFISSRLFLAQGFLYRLRAFFISLGLFLAQGCFGGGLSHHRLLGSLPEANRSELVGELAGSSTQFPELFS